MAVHKLGFISDYLTYAFYDIDDVSMLKRHVEAKTDMTWDWAKYQITLNGVWIPDNFVFPNTEYLEVRCFKRSRYTDKKRDESIPVIMPRIDTVVKRPFLNPLLSKPEFHTSTSNKQYIGVYACKKCGGPVVFNVADCAYCGYSLDWQHT
jgi:hypothetical protein